MMFFILRKIINVEFLIDKYIILNKIFENTDNNYLMEGGKT
jgi:hypothetical protein